VGGAARCSQLSDLVPRRRSPSSSCRLASAHLLPALPEGTSSWHSCPTTVRRVDRECSNDASGGGHGACPGSSAPPAPPPRQTRPRTQRDSRWRPPKPTSLSARQPGRRGTLKEATRERLSGNCSLRGLELDHRRHIVVHLTLGERKGEPRGGGEEGRKGPLIPNRPAMIKFVLLVNKQGQTRLAKYTDATISAGERHGTPPGLPPPRDHTPPPSSVSPRRLAAGLSANDLPTNPMLADERRFLEGEIVRRCIRRTDKQCSVVEHRQHKASRRATGPFLAPPT